MTTSFLSLSLPLRRKMERCRLPSREPIEISSKTPLSPHLLKILPPALVGNLFAPVSR